MQQLIENRIAQVKETHLALIDLAKTATIFIGKIALSIERI